MPRLRRVVAALLGVLLLQLTLQESAWACVRTSGPRGAATDPASASRSPHEPGMAMHGSTHARASADESPHASGTAPAVAPAHRSAGGDVDAATVAVPERHDTGDSCCTPGAMHGTCGTAGCLTVVTVVEVDAAMLADRAAARWPGVAEVPAALRAAPDVPPPKA